MKVRKNTMKWKIKTFNELTTTELYEILRIRAEVFVVEQSCVYQDLDLKDKKAYHLFLEDNDEVVAYLRILEKDVSYPEISIGRVLVKEEYRGRGLARKLMQKAVSFIEEVLREKEIRISAQKYLLKFYKSLGFTVVSEVYLEDGIEHVEMLYSVDKKLL